ncbi:MAG: hypothetical protein ACJAT0_002716 [Nonlabens sp.]|jgi:hypothetical protein
MLQFITVGHDINNSKYLSDIVEYGKNKDFLGSVIFTALRLLIL